ncbi:MAG: hypothetical protein ABIE07_14255 [Candidatus Zixiibacteriota bacterium]
MTNHSKYFSLIAAIMPLSIVAISALFILSCSSEREKYLFRYKYGAPGKTVNVIQTTNQSGTIFKNDKWVSDIDWTSYTYLTLKTSEILDDNTYIMDVFYNTENKDLSESNFVVKFPDSTCENVYHLHTTDRDSVINIEFPANGPSEDRINYYKTISSPCYANFPKEAIAPGHKWRMSIPSVMLNGDTAISVLDYVFKGFTKKKGYDCALIEIKAEIAAAFLSDPGDSSLTQREEWHTVKGMMYFSLEHGWPVQLNFSSHVLSHRQKRDALEYYIDDNGDKIDIPESEREITDMFFKVEYDENTSFVYSGIESH